VILILLSLLLPERSAPDDGRAQVSGGDYPVPPLDLSVPTKPKRRTKAKARASQREPVAVPAGQSSPPPAKEEASDGSV
jgi:NADH-quinone oxidoreductase subunit H